jgi:putative lipoic acid-binding regulatory protein
VTPARRVRLLLPAPLVGLLLVLAVGAAADETVPSQEAMELVMQQLAALRAHDFTAAYALASTEMRRHFSRGEFEWMVKRAHPEIASSAYAFVVRTHESGGYLYVTVKVHGKNGKDVEALYELVREGGGLKVNALLSRSDDGVL